MKVIVMFVLLCVDLSFNCSFDYDNYNISGSDLNIVPLAIQLIIEISIFLVLFLTMAETYLFRVGLLGILIKKFRYVLILQPIYICFTLVTGVYRIKRLGDGYDLVGLWKKDELFLLLSTFHKCVPIIYYVANMRATLDLGSTIYFDRSVWVSLVKQYKMEV